MLDVVVDRRTWYRGNDSFLSRLLRKKDGKMCCLGSVCLAAGISEDDIKDVAYPDKFKDNPKLSKLFDTYASTISQPEINRQMAIINDSLAISDDIREQKLIEIARQADINLSFAN